MDLIDLPHLEFYLFHVSNRFNDNILARINDT